jgi:hypothetical protein
MISNVIKNSYQLESRECSLFSATGIKRQLKSIGREGGNIFYFHQNSEQRLSIRQLFVNYEDAKKFEK